MVRWIERVAYALQPVYKRMRAELLSGDHLQVDETPIRYLEPGAGKALQGYFWTYTAAGGDVIFDWHASRAGVLSVADWVALYRGPQAGG